MGVNLGDWLSLLGERAVAAAPTTAEPALQVVIARHDEQTREWIQISSITGMARGFVRRHDGEVVRAAGV